MRVGLKNKPKGVTYTVTLDDVDISKRCFGFDTVERWADCYVLDAKGELAIVEIAPKSGWKQYELVEERLFGDVCVVKHVESDDEDGKRAHSVWVAGFYKAKAYFHRIGAVK